MSSALMVNHVWWIEPISQGALLADPDQSGAGLRNAMGA